MTTDVDSQVLTKLNELVDLLKTKVAEKESPEGSPRTYHIPLRKILQFVIQLVRLRNYYPRRILNYAQMAEECKRTGVCDKCPYGENKDAC